MRWRNGRKALRRRKIYPLTGCAPGCINRIGRVRTPGPAMGTALCSCLSGQVEPHLSKRAHLGRRKAAQARHAKQGAVHGWVVSPTCPNPPRAAGESSKTDCGAICLIVKMGKPRIAERSTGWTRSRRSGALTAGRRDAR